MLHGCVKQNVIHLLILRMIEWDSIDLLLQILVLCREMPQIWLFFVHWCINNSTDHKMQDKNAHNFIYKLQHVIQYSVYAVKTIC